MKAEKGLDMKQEISLLEAIKLDLDLDLEPQMSQLEADISAELEDYNFCPAQVLAAKGKLKKIEQEERKILDELFSRPIEIPLGFNKTKAVQQFYYLQKIRVVKKTKVKEEHLFILNIRKELGVLLDQVRDLDKEVKRIIESEPVRKYAVYFELLDLEDQHPNHSVSLIKRVEISSTIEKDYQEMIKNRIQRVEYLKKKKALLEQAQVKEEHHKMLAIDKEVCQLAEESFELRDELHEEEFFYWEDDLLTKSDITAIEKYISDDLKQSREEQDLIQNKAREDKDGIAYFKAELDHQKLKMKQLDIAMKTMEELVEKNRKKKVKVKNND